MNANFKQRAVQIATSKKSHEIGCACPECLTESKKALERLECQLSCLYNMAADSKKGIGGGPQPGQLSMVEEFARKIADLKKRVEKREKYDSKKFMKEGNKEAQRRHTMPELPIPWAESELPARGPSPAFDGNGRYDAIRVLTDPRRINIPWAWEIEED